MAWFAGKVSLRNFSGHRRECQEHSCLKIFDDALGFDEDKSDTAFGEGS